ncbi:hypothetical protein [Cetobacterium sp.]|uniref:hypothetical protein n=1 Tax=Cetobacterium sp. TaxID=2071632 RepID=UPI003F407292
MKRKLIILFGAIILGATQTYSSPTINDVVTTIPTENGNVELPEPPQKSTDEEIQAGWKLEKNYTALLQSKLNVFVPLEILSDIDINAVVIDDEELNIPFELELNKEPEKKDYYKLKFSENEIDIDSDGKIDTFIYSPKYINQRIVKENYVQIKGKNISKDGDYYKKIYITIEVDE